MKRKKFMIIGTSLLVVGITLMMYPLSRWVYGTYQFFSSGMTQKDVSPESWLIVGGVLAVFGAVLLHKARSLKLKDELRKKALKENASHDTGENDLMSTVFTEEHDPWLNHVNAH